MPTLAEGYKAKYSATQEEEMSLEDYLQLCRRIPAPTPPPRSACWQRSASPSWSTPGSTSGCRASSPTASSSAIPPSPSSTAWRTRSSQIVAFFKHAAQGLEERKQILYLLGPVGGGKSSIAERLKQLMERKPIYALKGSPVNESPLGLFAARRVRRRARSPTTAFRAAI